MKAEEELIDLLMKDTQNIQTLCRICLCGDVDSSEAIFKEEDNETIKLPLSLESDLSLRHKINVYGHINVQKDAGPSLLCETCCDDLNFVHMFRIKCQEADILLRKVLKDIPIKNEDVLEKTAVEFENLKDEKKTREIELVDIKEEIVDEYEVDCDDFEYEFIPDIKKKKKNPKKNKSKKVKDEAIETGTISLKLENDLIDKNLISDNKDEDQKIEKKFCCHLCNKPLATKYSLTSHIEKMHGEQKKIKMGIVSGYGANRRFHCTYCEYKCRRRQALHYHMTIHTGLKPFKCDECPKSFSQHGSLYTHKKTHSDKMYYTCQECGKQFKHRDIFRNHRRVHSNEFKFVCKICNKGLKTQRTLDEHVNRHLQIKNYSCEVCGSSFVTRVELANHLRVHNKKNAFKCTFCEYASYSKKILAVHIKRHLGERSFGCEYCDYTCYTQGELKFHTRKHTKEQNYPCPACDMKFRHSSSVNKHMLRRHGEKFKWNNVVDRRIVK